ncbi:MAG: dockerin type I repeat-containing protein [candidate division Zixibacteria bacterium]|nr:dockerin type I repeat-containing protein [candidate division Zixibacteria bacterium]
MRLLLLTISIMLLLSPFVQGQEPLCGDANSDGANNLGDAVYIFQYLFDGGPPTPLPDPDFANWDNKELLTVRDVNECIDYCFSTHWQPDCDLIGPPIVPEIDSNIVLLYSDRVPPGETMAEIAMTLYFDGRPYGLELPLNIRVDGQIPIIDSVSYLPQHQSQGSDFPGYMIYPENGDIAIGYNVLMGSIEPIDQICTIYLTVPESTEERPIMVEWTRLTPIQSTVADSNCIYPMVVRSYLQTFEPILTPTCCINAGDANDDGQTNIGDAVYIIDWIFKGGPDMPCMSQGDANYDGSANAGDAIYLINYAFKGGPPPLCSDY